MVLRRKGGLWLGNLTSKRSHTTNTSKPWRPPSVLDDWVQKEARPISLKQLTFFARNLNEEKLLISAEYLRNELAIRLAHRLRDLQLLPYTVVGKNAHISHVYDLYYNAFDAFRKVSTIKTVEENDAFCELVRSKLNDHLSIIPRLAMGILQCKGMIQPDTMDHLVYSLLTSRISRRVIAEHHLALTHNFKSPQSANVEDEFIGQVFLRCNAQRVLRKCTKIVHSLVEPGAKVPEIQLDGDLNATFPYILSHLEYIIGELFRNSVFAVVEHSERIGIDPPPIKVLVCETPQHVVFRISDQGGGIPPDLAPFLWSFAKGPRREIRIENLKKVPKLAANVDEIESAFTPTSDYPLLPRGQSMSSLTHRSPHIKLGIGLPMSRIYAEYWAGKLDVHSLDGYGTDTFLHISKLGNKNEQLSARASMDKL